MERDAKRKLIKTAPPAFIEGSSPKLLQFEKNDEEKIRNCIPGIVTSAKNVFFAVSSTGSTSSMYISEAYSYVSTSNQPNDWLDTVMQLFDNLAKYKLHRTEIPKKLEKLYQGLGDKFSVALQSADKAKSDLEHQSNSIMAMRNFLQSFWGSLLELARQSKPSIWQGFQKSKLSQPDTRDLVAKSFSNNLIDERKLVQLLQNMSDLYNEMSGSEVGKNLGLNNLPIHNTLFTRWFLLIDDLARILQVEIN
jgi:hypothetical protein